MAAFASTLIQFDSHTMRVIGVDGTYTQEQDADQIRVAPGQRYRILLDAQPTSGSNYAFLASLDENRDFAHDPAPSYPFNVTGYIVYDEAAALPEPYVVDSWSPADDFTFVSLDDQGLLGEPDVSVILNFNFCIVNGLPAACFNNVSYVAPKVPSLFTAFTTGEENTNPLIYGQVNPYVASKGQIVQIVVNNMDSAIHPFHLHGHQFQVIDKPSSGGGNFTGDSANFPAVPMRRDTVTVNPGSYVVLRFQADNPGVWLFHCHIEWHVIMGLSATIIEAPEELRGLPIPEDSQAACAAQNISIAGNAAGNTVNLTDLSGANDSSMNPYDGATYPIAERTQISQASRLRLDWGLGLFRH